MAAAEDRMRVRNKLLPALRLLQVINGERGGHRLARVARKQRSCFHLQDARELREIITLLPLQLEAVHVLLKLRMFCPSACSHTRLAS